ncbi:hypothetical protein K402DRAFT_352039 [Aulographum hederae CBS 113979]|uniref:C3H1-type domain-containing protein n=1 Tax=Aulographum hederae CBS 113979 TaxID=1176131 RepID=A0A6G1H567_9PEZI|nr:hypothetical protein K402DRAFT_352039 [Aulographum hederae CBS 113979]
MSRACGISTSATNANNADNNNLTLLATQKFPPSICDNALPTSPLTELFPPELSNQDAYASHIKPPSFLCFDASIRSSPASPAKSFTMVVCKFFLQGSCKFGDRCKNEHPRSGGGGHGGQNFNTFSPLQNNPPRGPSDGRSSYPNRRSDGYRNNKIEYPYKLDPEWIKNDLTEDLPNWILSAYGPGRDAPRELIEGQLEQSFEEMRLTYYLAQANGNAQQGAEMEQRALQEARESIRRILGDLDGACRYVVEGEKIHPNRHDVCKQSDSGGPRNLFAKLEGAVSKPFGAGQPTTSQSGGLGQPSGSPAFGKPAFGQPSAPAAGGGFGRPAFGQPAAPAPSGGFGQPAPAAQSAGFGQASPMGQTSTFGQASGMGQTGSFGKPGLPSGGAFGQPAFGQPAFGQSSSSGGGGGFGKPTTGFGQPAFGQPGPGNNTGNSAPAFGQSQSPFGQASPQPATGVFGSGQQQNTANPFGSSNSQQQSASAPSNPFGLPNQPQGQAPPSTAGQSNGFGRPTTSQGQGPSNPFGQQQSQPSKSNGPSATYVAGPGGRQQLQTWHGKPVKYIEGVPFYHKNAGSAGGFTSRFGSAQRNTDDDLERIFHPNGPPMVDGQPVPEEFYDFEGSRRAFEVLRNTGQFEGHMIPEDAPLVDWCDYDC